MVHKHFVSHDGIGYVALIDSMPSQANMDEAIVTAARVSYDSSSTTTVRGTEGLLRFLLRHDHTTPFEMVEFKFLIRMPLFIARQHLRHRTASVNEVSARYSKVQDEYFIPDELREQSTLNRQGSHGKVVGSDELLEVVRDNMSEDMLVYNELLKSGVCREQARIALPQAMYTSFYWKINLHNLMHYLHLRMGEGAQKEIRDYANTIYKIVEPLAPMTFRAFRDFKLNSIKFTRPELDILSGLLGPNPPEEFEGLSKGESNEFKAKLLKMYKKE